jgi:hypothetical protein
MIATAVFSIILLITTTSIIGISNTYIKGTVQDQTQNNARTILSDISSGIQFNLASTIVPTSSASSSNVYYFCLGNDVYVYNLDLKLTSVSNQAFPSQNSSWGLIRFTNPETSCPQSSDILFKNIPANLPISYSELLGNNERLGGLAITEVALSSKPVYTINLVIGYGDNDLLNDQYNYDTPPYTAGYTNGSNSSLNKMYSYTCSSGSDSSFCAVATLTTTVVPTVSN